MSHKIRGLPYRIRSDGLRACVSGKIIVESTVADENSEWLVGSLAWEAVRPDSIGYFSAPRYKSEADKKFGNVPLGMYVDDIWVKDSCQHRGIGTAMYRELCKIAQKCKFSYVEGAVVNRNALKARSHVFGKPSGVWIQRGYEGGGEEGGWNSEEQALKELPGCKGDISELAAIVRHDVGKCSL